jgi:acetyl esterase/lipase
MKAEMKVINIDYRLAPENTFPAGIDDVYAVTKAVMEDSIKDRTRVSLAGDSAGGNLLMAVIVRWYSEEMDKQLGTFASQILIYPLLQLLYFNTTSYQTVVPEQSSLTTRTVHAAYSLYVAGNRSLISSFQSGQSVSKHSINKIVKRLWRLPVTDKELNHYPDETTIYESILTNPLCSPLAAESVKGFPPAFILTAEYDVLRDDGIIYGNRLEQAGVHVETLNVPICHAFINFLKRPFILPAAVQSMDKIVQFLNMTRHE